MLRVYFERSGGLANIRLTAEADIASSRLAYGAKKLTRDLSPNEIHDLGEMVKAADFFHLPAKITARMPGTDQFEYVITVETEDRRHRVHVIGAAVSQELQSLLDYLTKLAKGG
jgi:hypothetical protein